MTDHLTTSLRGRLLSRLLTAFVLAALISPLAAAPAAAQVEIAEVRIYIRDAKTGEDITWVNPDGTVELPQGTTVRLRLEARPHNLSPRYPSGAFVMAPGSRQPAGIKEANRDMGSAVLQTYGRAGTAIVRYTITDRDLAIPDELRTGAFGVRVLASAAELAQPEEEELGIGERTVDALFQGILLREAPPQGTEDFVRRVQEGGYVEAIAVAVDIANSDESTSAIYQRGVSPQQRLEALYEHLLGQDPRQVDRDQWQADLLALGRGEIDRVVGGMVRTQEFRDRMGFRPIRPVRRY